MRSDKDMNKVTMSIRKSKYGNRSTRKLRANIAILLLVMLLTSCFQGYALAEDEEPEAIFSGIADARVILQNISYTDIAGLQNWEKEAIYETGALNLMEGYGGKVFAPGDMVTKEQAIALVLKIAGRSEDAKKAAEEINQKRNESDKKNNPTSMWADGYLTIAEEEGLISEYDLNDALGIQSKVQKDPTRTPFIRSAPVTRQEFAYWIAKALKLEPIYDEISIYTSYNDWNKADPEKIPYISAVTQNLIMGSDQYGNFNPNGRITRSEAAQIIKNAGNIILPLLDYVKNTGIVEDIKKISDHSSGTEIIQTLHYLRNTDGKLYRIDTYKPKAGSTSSSSKNGTSEDLGENEIIVCKNGDIGDSSLLKAGDRVEYIVSEDLNVLFLKVLSNVNDTDYLAAKVNNVDTENQTISVQAYFTLQSPDIEQARKSISFNIKSTYAEEIYRYSSNVQVFIDNVYSTIEKLTPGSYVVLSIKGELVTEVRTFRLTGSTEEKGIVKGIVEDNNPQLGYITLYNEDGSGIDSKESLILYRTYSYTDPSAVEVYKNHELADISDVEPGDTVFIKLDDNGDVISISAVDNYQVKYAKIISKKSSTLLVKYDDGTQQLLNIDNNVLVVLEGRLTKYDVLNDGDRIKLTLLITPDQTVVKEIEAEGDEHLITNIYKGTISRIDTLSNNVIVQNLKELKNGEWVLTDKKGMTSIKLAEEYEIYNQGIKTQLSKLKYYKNNEVYIAVEKDYGGQERAVQVVIKNSSDSREVLYQDNIAYIDQSSEQINLGIQNKSVKITDESIIVKYGRLVLPYSISQNDPVCVAASESYESGDLYAHVVQIDEKPVLKDYTIYRGRIKSINAGKDFTLESYSVLDDPEWDYYNTPKTFQITSETRILDENGVVNSRSFTGYGQSGYIKKTVYVVAKGTDAVLISTAPYGHNCVKGEIYEVSGGLIGEEGETIQQPTQIKITSVKAYNPVTHIWTAQNDMSIDILVNSIIIKGDKIVKPEELKEGDTIRVMKRLDGVSTEGYIIIDES